MFDPVIIVYMITVLNEMS